MSHFPYNEITFLLSKKYFWSEINLSESKKILRQNSMDFIIVEIRLNDPMTPSSLHGTYRNHMTLMSESVHI